jgi:Fe-S-cluster containining protein
MRVFIVASKNSYLQREEKVGFKYPGNVRFHCLLCGICCGDTKEKARHILLLDAEAEKIAKATLKPVSGFAEKIEGHEPYIYEMKKTAKEGKCVFLENERCTIYALRPLICRFYPFELRVGTNGKHEFLCTTECPGVGRGKKLKQDYFERLFQEAKFQQG